MVSGIPFTNDVRVMRRQGLGRRHVRRPQHRFNLITKPYQIQPCFIAPVLPGETINHALLQSQVWSDPLADGMKNIGWWCEYWGFYVRFTDLPGFNESATLASGLVDMMLTDASTAGFQDADGNAWTYAYPGAIDYALEATKAVVSQYFRDELDEWDDFTLDNVPIAAIYGGGLSDWSDKLTLDSAYADRTVAVPDSIGEMASAVTEWQALRDAGLVQGSYDDWLRTYGGSSEVTTSDIASDRMHKAELVFHFREFTYPNNTVEPSTGVPATAVGWRVAADAKKRFRCDQPGWFIGFNCVRPKVYLGTQQGALAGAMQQRLDWLPAVLNHELDLGHKMFSGTAGPLANVMTADHWIDLRDLLNYGDQFINYATPATGTTGVPFVALPAVTAERRYASSSQIMALFKDTTNGRFRQDGVCSMSIATDNKQPSGQTLTLGATT